MKDFTALLPGLERIVCDAIAVILPLYAAKDPLIERKKDGSPVTEADRAAEKAILAGLSALTPDIPIVSEEQMAAGQRPDCSRGLWWCVDPIDGTREFIARTDEFSVSIGLIAGGYPVVGALGVPVPGIIYIGGSGLGAWRITGSVRRKIQTRATPTEGLTALVSRFHRDGSKAGIALAACGVSRVIPCGSAWKFGRIAEGAADIMIRYGQTYEWDTAGGQAILEGAGGFVQTLDKSRLAYGKPDFINGPFQGLATQAIGFGAGSA